MNIYYVANSIYQFAYALPLYRRLGGTFVVNKPKKYLHFKRYMSNTAQMGEHNFRSTPNVIIVPREKTCELNGVIIFLANTIVPEHDYSNAITLFHEHGTSDKLYEGGAEIGKKKLQKYDYLLLSGAKNKQRLIDIGLDIADEKLIAAGSFRFDGFLSDPNARQNAQRHFGIKDTDKKTILYAPTWRFGNGTLEQYLWRFIKELTPEFNLIVRPHYHDRRYGKLIYQFARMTGHKNIYYSKPEDIVHHDTYTAFAASDLMISDVSSVIYEYLITKNPLIVIDNGFVERHRMPENMDIMQHVDLYDGHTSLVDLINKNISQQPSSMKTYQHLLQSCFYHSAGGSLDATVNFINTLTSRTTPKES